MKSFFVMFLEDLKVIKEYYQIFKGKQWEWKVVNVFSCFFDVFSISEINF